MRYFLAGFALFVALVSVWPVSAAACSRKPPLEVFPDMIRQPKVRRQTGSEFFANQLNSRLRWSAPWRAARLSRYPAQHGLSSPARRISWS